jgi:hypothetical protein
MNGSGRNQTYMFDRQIGIFFRVREGGVRAEEALGAGSLILIPLIHWPTAFLAFF